MASEKKTVDINTADAQQPPVLDLEIDQSWLRSEAFHPDGSIKNPSIAFSLSKFMLHQSEDKFFAAVSILLDLAFDHDHPDACFVLATLKSPAATKWESLYKEVSITMDDLADTKAKHRLFMNQQLATDLPTTPPQAVSVAEGNNAAEEATLKDALARMQRLRPPYYYLDSPDDREALIDRAVATGTKGPWFEYKKACHNSWRGSKSFQDLEELSKSPWRKPMTSRENLEMAAEESGDYLWEFKRKVLSSNDDEFNDFRDELEKKSSTNPTVCFALATIGELAEHYSEEKRLQLLHAAAYPAAPAKPIAEALLELGKLVQRGNPEEAMHHFQTLGRLSQIGRAQEILCQIKASECLHILELKHKDISEIGVDQLLRDSEWYPSPTSLLTSAIACVRDKKNRRYGVKKACAYLENATEEKAYSDGDHDAAFWARRLLRLVNSNFLHDDVWLLTQRLAKRNDDSETVAFITLSDLECIRRAHKPSAADKDALQRGISLKDAILDLEKSRGKPWRKSLFGHIDVDGYSTHRGLVYCLQTDGPVSERQLADCWNDDGSLIQQFLWGLMHMSGRLGLTNYEEAIRRFKSVVYFVDSDSLHAHKADGYKHRWLKDTARDFLRYAERLGAEEKLRQALDAERRQMLSFLSHTLTNAMAGTAGTLQQIAGDLARAGGATDTAPFAYRLAPQATSVAMVESLVQVFKLYTADPQALRQMWARDEGGRGSAVGIAALAIRQALLRFYFASGFESAFERLMPDGDWGQTSRTFMADIVSLDMAHRNDVDSLLQWVDRSLAFLQIAFVDVDRIHLTSGGPKAILIFALVGELLGNALKYSSGRMPISLTLKNTGRGLEIACTNAVNPKAPMPSGGKTGLTFIRLVCDLVGARYDQALSEGVFSFAVTLPIESPS